MDHIAATTAFLALILLAGASDLRTRRIPNALTVSGLGVALALRGATGVEPLASGLAGALIAFVPAALLVVAGGLGGGDAKLLAAVGAFVGPAGLPTALFVTAVVGGAMGAVVVVAAELSATITAAARSSRGPQASSERCRGWDAWRDRDPYGVAIAGAPTGGGGHDPLRRHDEGQSLVSSHPAAIWWRW
jgi:prepilin peptidase CpaA